MKLTNHQIKLLQFYESHRETPLSLGGIIRSFSISWLLIVVVALGSVGLIVAGWPSAGWLYLGICIGAVLRDVNRIIALRRTWPVVHEIVRWERVRELMEAGMPREKRQDEVRRG